ncbi:MAG: hypothetical protein HY744_08375 [Deltaproteobacteria bacterium]|nr:hypothetical protein [Deltaproteobacteria bacterium]
MARVSGIVRPAAVAAVACCAALAAAAAGARAAPGPGAESGYSAYELETLRAQLGQRRAELDPAPEGKVVEAVDVCVLDVIEERDPAPNFLNWFHATSREGVIRRELLLRAG